MTEEEILQDAYTSLGLSGPDLSALSTAEIRRAYRAQALRLHPDKNRDDPRAGAHFAAVFLAYEALIDPDRRAEIDAKRASHARRREERERLDGRRRQMRDELDLREKTASYGVTQRGDGQLDAQTLARMQDEITRLREEALRPSSVSARKKTMTGSGAYPGNPRSVWAEVSGYTEFINAEVPFEEFERDVLASVQQR